MIQSLISITFVLAFGLLISCGDNSHAPRGAGAKVRKSAPLTPENSAHDDATAGGAIALPEPETATRSSEEKPFTFEGKKNQMLVPYALPKPLEEHLEKTTLKPTPKEEASFELDNPYLKIDVDASTMTFTAVIKVKGKADENVQLRCSFKKDDVPWLCNNMYPVDQKIAKQRRLQASVNCLDNYKCEDLGFDFYAVIDGKKVRRHFETKPVRVKQASSGDIEEFLDGVAAGAADEDQSEDGEQESEKDQSRLTEDETGKDDIPKEEPKKKDEEQVTPGVETKPTPEEPEPTPEQPKKEEPKEIVKTPEELPDLTDNEIEDSLKNDDTNEGLEVNGPIETVKPEDTSEFSIPGVGELAPKTMGKNAKNQAHRRHTSGSLLAASQLPRKKNSGYMIRTQDDVKGSPQRAYGTDIMMELIQTAAAKTNAEFPGRPAIVVANIAKKTGGRLCRGKRCHASHQTGLDADVSFPSKTKKVNLWDANARSSDMDMERFLFMSSTMACAKGDPVIAFFVDTNIKKRLCAFAKKSGKDLRNPKDCAYKALRRMIHWGGHKNHFHMRLRCPGNAGCQNSNVVPKFKGTGCN